jgi:hypothetical protein
MKFSNGKIEIELEHPHTFNIAERAGFKPAEECEKPSEEVKEEPVIEPIAETKIENNVGKKHCKKCTFTCDNQGELLAHYRNEHKN